MIRMRIQVEEMHVYYFIAKKLINSAKLGFMGIMSSSEEKLINSIYHSDDLEEIAELSKKLFDKLDKEKTELKVNTNPISFKDTEEIISEALSYSINLLFKPQVLENVTKALKNDLSTHDKILLCVEKISQTKRVLAGLSPEERKNVLEGKGFEVTNQDKKKKKKEIVKAVDEENVTNVANVKVAGPIVDVNEVPLDEEVVEAFDDDVDEGNKDRKAFTVEDVPVEPIENIVNGINIASERKSSIDKKLEELEDEAEILDFDEDDSNDENVIEEIVDENNDSQSTSVETEETNVSDDVDTEEDNTDINNDSDSEAITDNVSIDEASVTEDIVQTVEEVKETSEEIEPVLEENVVDYSIDEVNSYVTEDIVQTVEEVKKTSGEIEPVVEENVVDSSIDEVNSSNDSVETKVADVAISEIVDIVEPSPLQARVEKHDIGFMPAEPEIVLPAEPDVVVPVPDTNNQDIDQFSEIAIENATKAEVVEDNGTDYAVPEIFKIIERDGVVVDEDI